MNLARISLDVLRAYVVFIESPNIVVAAESLGVSQPQLSKQLRELQDQCQAPLFLFIGRKKSPTPYGRQIYQILRERLHGLQVALTEVDLKGLRPNSQVVRIGGRIELTRRFAPSLEFAGTLEFVGLTGQAALTHLRRDELEIAISQYELDSHLFVRKPFLTDHFLLAAPRRWRLELGSLEQRLTALMPRPYLSYGKSDPLEALLARIGNGQRPKCFRQISDWEILSKMTATGQGWSILPSQFALNQSALDCQEIPLTLLHGTVFYVYYSRNHSKLKWFTDLVRELQTFSGA